MTWDEINKNYERNGRAAKDSQAGIAALDENWKKLMESTDKLLWLFMISNESRKEKVKTASD